MSVSRQRGKRRWTRRLTGLASVSSLILGVGLWQRLSLSALDNTASQMLELKDQASMVRLSVIAVLFVTWPMIIRLASRAFDPSLRSLHDARLHVCGWLLVIELLVGQSLLSRAFG